MKVCIDGLPLNSYLMLVIDQIAGMQNSALSHKILLRLSNEGGTFQVRLAAGIGLHKWHDIYWKRHLADIAKKCNFTSNRKE